MAVTRDVEDMATDDQESTGKGMDIHTEDVVTKEAEDMVTHTDVEDVEDDTVINIMTKRKNNAGNIQEKYIFSK